MSLKIRLSRGGAKKRPFYRIVVADARMPRDGRFVEKIGTFDPLRPKDDATRLVLRRQRHLIGQFQCPLGVPGDELVALHVQRGGGAGSALGVEGGEVIGHEADVGVEREQLVERRLFEEPPHEVVAAVVDVGAARADAELVEGPRLRGGDK